MRADIAQESLKSTPPVAVVAAANVSAWTLSDWVMLATLGYIALQAGYLLWKWWREYRKARRG